MNNIIDLYFNWCKSRFIVEEANNGWFAINTPFLNQSNDMMRIFYQIIENDVILLSDDAETMSDLRFAGIDVKDEVIRKVIKQILYCKGEFELIDNNDEIVGQTTLEDFPRAMHDFIQALISIDDLRIVARLKSYERYTPNKCEQTVAFQAISPKAIPLEIAL